MPALLCTLFNRSKGQRDTLVKWYLELQFRTTSLSFSKTNNTSPDSEWLYGLDTSCPNPQVLEKWATVMMYPPPHPLVIISKASTLPATMRVTKKVALCGACCSLLTQPQLSAIVPQWQRSELSCKRWSPPLLPEFHSGYRYRDNSPSSTRFCNTACSAITCHGTSPPREYCEGNTHHRKTWAPPNLY